MRQLAVTSLLFLASSACADLDLEPYDVGATAQALSSVTWYSEDGSPEGTPPDVTFDTAASSPTSTVVNVTIHGFWRTLWSNGDRLIVPGQRWPAAATTGPEYPVLTYDIATPPDATTVGAAVSVTFSRTYTTTEVKAWSGTPLTSWTYTAAYADRPHRVAGVVRGGRIELHPFSFDAATGQTTLYRQARFTLTHTGTTTPVTAITRDRAAVAAARLANWASVASVYPTDTARYYGYLYVIYADALATPAGDLVTRRKAMGLRVTSAAVSSIGASCSQVQAAIAQWAGGIDDSYDKYVILVGDRSQIPACNSSAHDDDGANYGTIESDDAYGSTLGGVKEKEVQVGRLMVNDPTRLTRLLNKTWAYEDNQNVKALFKRVILAAHNQQQLYADEAGRTSDANGNLNVGPVYSFAHEDASGQTYAVQPTWDKQYGHLGADHPSLALSLDKGAGVLSYRGHGEPSGWYEWGDPAAPSSDTTTFVTQVSALTNTLTPVVWSLACETASFAFVDAWLGQLHGGLAVYAASILTGQGYNDDYDRALFALLYGAGITRHGQLVDAAEAVVHLQSRGPRDVEQLAYGLYGDPTVVVRRKTPRVLALTAPATMARCPSGCTLQTTLRDASGVAIAGARVSAWKAGVFGTDEVFANRYTDSLGRANLTVTPAWSGILWISAQDDDGNTVWRQVNVP